MAFSIDPRPSYFGDRIVVTGTYAATDASLDLSSLVSVIDFAGVTPTAAPTAVTIATTPSVDLNIQDSVQINGTTLTIHGGDDAVAGASTAGKFFVIGRRS